MEKWLDEETEREELETDLLYESELGSSEADETRFAWDESWGAEPEEGAVHQPVRDGRRDAERTPEEVLERYWGYREFRPLQRDIVQSALEGYDTMALLPTGGGKSICFQVPGLMRPGITLVITPLISLMKDQVDHLRARGIKAAAIHSGLTGDRIRQTMSNCLYGQYKFLYVSPERLASESFRAQLSELRIGLLVIDECHCICQWGYDFRPSYLNILELRNYIPNVPVMALTATATPEVVEDIRRILSLGEEARFFQKSFYRDNVSYSIRYADDKMGELQRILSRVPGSVVIYCRNRELCRDTTRYIKEEMGETATFYHAGLTYTEREIRQERWMRGEYRIMVATNAFGMGIDKPDVRLVIHLTMPSSLEEYFQEAGRAGRDGQLSYAVALVARSDIRLLRLRFADAFPDEEYVMYTFDMLCNYFAVGEGEGKDRGYDFDIEHFTRVFRMRPAQTRSAIQILELSGFLEYQEDDAVSRLMILCRREDLYAEYVGHDEILRALLRRYTGLFSDYVYISETDLSLLTGYTHQEVYAQLSELSRKGLLHYIPKSNVPRIVFRIRREDTRYLRLTAAAYYQRKDRMRERIDSVLNYVSRDDTCRSRLLLRYFGERATAACAKCDVCLQRTSTGQRNYIIEDCYHFLREQQEAGAKYALIQDVVWGCGHTAEEVVDALRYLSAVSLEGKISLIGDVVELLGELEKG